MCMTTMELCVFTFRYYGVIFLAYHPCVYRSVELEDDVVAIFIPSQIQLFLQWLLAALLLQHSGEILVCVQQNVTSILSTSCLQNVC